MKSKIINGIKKNCPILLAPLIVCAVMLYVFSKFQLYPFGKATVAWCDMNYQVVPMLMDMHDILSGKDGLFLNMHNAAGMDMWGVFCFFLSNPFSFLVKFTEKSNILFFVNILVLLKCMCASAACALYFRVCRKKLSGGFSVSLSIMYGLCGYGMLFFQNIMWLDIMYLFPLLMIGLHKLINEKKNLIYIITLSLMMIMNFYISYMVVIFLLMYMAVYYFLTPKEKYSSVAALKFVSGSLLSALITAVIWLPSILSTASSGRVKNVRQTIEDSPFLTSYMTVIPLLLCTAFIFLLSAYSIIRRKRHTLEQRNNLLLFAAMLVPFIIEPINLLWHTGDYMSFPARYGFITVFLGLMCCADVLEEKIEGEEDIPLKKQIIVLPVMVALVVWYYIYTSGYIGRNFSDITRYTDSLWGDKTSLDMLARLFFITILCYGIIYAFYRKKMMIKTVFALLLVFLCAVEGIGNVKIYMASPSVNNTARTTDYVDAISLGDKISDKDFYRVTTDYWNTDYNMTGALGYNSISHYSSLNSHDFMAMQRQLGYSTVWMKAGGSGGTELTDSLYNVRYKIVRDAPADEAIVKGIKASIVRHDDYYNGLGIVSSKELLSAKRDLSNMTRAQVQEYFFSNIFGGNKKLITEYKYAESASNDVTIVGNSYHLTNGSFVRYSIPIKGRQSLYADCYNGFSNDLGEDYFESISVRVNGEVIENKYPGSDRNGLLYLGEFSDQTVLIEMVASKTIDCFSFGVFGLDLDILSDAIKTSKCANLNYTAGKLYGSVDAQKDQTLFLAVPYSDGMIVKINGESVKPEKVLSDMTAFTLKSGKNDIEITMIPKGFIPGIIISVLGIGLTVFYFIFGKKIKLPKRVVSVVELVMAAACIISILLVYAFPIILSVI